MKITVCIGSSCHIKGSQQVVEQLRRLIFQNSLEDRISIAGAFCMGGCMNGVCVKIGNTMFSLQPENVPAFFDTEVQGRLNGKSIKPGTPKTAKVKKITGGDNNE